MRLVSIIAVFVLLFMPLAPVWAAEYSIPESSEDDLAIDQNDDTGFHADGYVPSTWRNLSKLYWAMGIFKFDDSKALDYFTMLHECELYRKYYHDDFLWQDLRNVMRETIKANIAEYPTRVEVILKIGLDRYDIGTEKFILSPATRFIKTKRVEFAGNIAHDICGEMYFFDVYPSSFIINFKHPFNLQEITVHPELAQVYIESRKGAKLDPNEDVYLSNLGRIAYLRLKIKVLQYNGQELGARNDKVFSFTGNVDGYEVYGDAARTMLLYNESIEQSIQERRRSTRDVSKAIDLDDGPLLKPQEPAGDTQKAP